MMSDNNLKAVLRRTVPGLIGSLLVASAIPFGLVLFMMVRIGYSWPTSLMAAALFPLGILAYAAYKLVPLATKLRSPPESMEGLSEEQWRERLDAMDEEMISSGRMTRAELDQIRSEAMARAEENANWLKAELEKASTDADRDRIMEEFNRRIRITAHSFRTAASDPERLPER